MNMRKTLLCCCCIAVVAAFSISQTAFGFQGTLGPQFQVKNSVNSIELIAGSSQRLRFEYDIPELMVENSEVVSVTAVAANEILITGKSPGISTITVSDSENNLQTITVEVTMDVRKLQRAFAAHFPDSQIQVNALKSSVILKGQVARADQMKNILAVAADYFPTNVINELQVNGSQNIAIKVKIYEVSRTKLRQLGVDWSYISPDFRFVSSISDLIQSVSSGGAAASGETLSFGVLNNGNTFNAFIQALEKNNIAKLLDQPVLVAQNGRPAEFLSGGEVPIQVASGLGTNSIEFRPFGTKLDLVPIVHGQGQMTLEVRAEVSEVANDLGGATGVPGFRVRRVNTGVKMKAGHTLALAGDYRELTRTEKKGIPGLINSAFWGPAFTAKSDEVNETELVFLITPRFISEVEPNRVPRLGPGQLTQSPSDTEFYLNGYMEVPNCNEDCPVNDRFDDPLAKPVNDLLPAYENATPVGQDSVINPYVSAMENQSQHNVKPTFKSLFRFPKSSSTPAQSSANPAQQARTGFLWPSQTKSR
jgi:pilus assembly protein CpaC